MSTRHRSPMRTLAAMLLALALLLMLVVPYVDAAETIALSKNVTLISQTLDGTVLDASAAATATTTVNVLLQRCTVQGAGLTVSGTTPLYKLGSTAITLHILDTTVQDATLTFRNYIPDSSLISVVNMTATMDGTTPLFDLRNFSLGWFSKGFHGSSMTIQRVRATWGAGDGGSVLQVGGSTDLITVPLEIFSLTEAVVTGAAHVLEITSQSPAEYSVSSENGLHAFDLIEFRDARGAFVYSNSATSALGSSYYGTIRFSNITMTGGGQPFFEARNGKAPAVANLDYGSIVFSAISNDGPLFWLVSGADITASSPKAKYSLRHINVNSVIFDFLYKATVPSGYDATSDETWNFYMGNITVAGTLLETINELAMHQLFATQLVGAYGEVIEVRQGGSWPQPSLGSAAAVNCVSDFSVTADFVELVPGVNRAECNCSVSNNNAPYCTTAVDPLVYYDGYSPSPATCDTENCDSCLFGQASQCGACALGYGLTASLGCENIQCDVAHCTGCAADNVCDSCVKGYKLNDKGQCKKDIPWWVWLIVGIAAAAVVAGIIVLVVCCVRRRKTKESSSSVRGSSNTAMRRDQSDATEMQQYGSFTSAGAAPLNRSAPSGAYQWSSADCNAGRTTQGSQVSFANPLDYDYQ